MTLEEIAEKANYSLEEAQESVKNLIKLGILEVKNDGFPVEYDLTEDGMEIGDLRFLSEEIVN